MSNLQDQTEKLLLSALGSPAAVADLIADIETTSTSEIADGAVTTTKIADLNVTTGKLAANAVTTAKLAANAVGSAQLAVDIEQYVDKNITTGQVLALHATPISLVPAPGVGYMNIVTNIYASITYNSIAYSFADVLEVRYTDGSGAVAGSLTQAFCQSSANASAVGVVTNGYTPVTNAALVAVAKTSDPTTGNSPIKIRVYYKTVPTLL